MASHTHTHTHTSTARRIVDAGCVELLSRGGARSSNVKCTPEIEAALEEYLGENCTYTLNVMRDMVRFDFGVELSTSTISNKLIGKLYTTKNRGSICMDVNADFVNEIYDKVKASPTFQEHFQGKKVVVVLDNAPAHNQTEENDDLVLLRLAPYSPMCNPTEGCFSVFKAKIKVHLALSREELVAARPRGTIAAARMEILEHAAMRCIGCMDLRLVNKMALHCQHAVAAAERMEDMQYST
ncbi:hypothetical protein PC110_g9566 [Phytophthora cactorum]|uniref:Tc1-like transposase DDE domain-containing protein n=1 Tax=Phytophthora cactorum TaxID=29920 RepID=A0A329SBG1_9STRA|nr:hypothetical protein PC110_g9566 [Phytophthora cactorum]